LKSLKTNKMENSSDYKKLDCPFDFTSRCTMGRCDCKPIEEPKDVILGYKTSTVAQMLDRAELKEPKEETIYKAAERLITSHPDFKTEGFSDYQNGRLNGILEGAEWQAARMYSEEDMKQFAFECVANFLSNDYNKVEMKLADVISDRVNNRFDNFKK